MNDRIRELAIETGISFGGHPMNPLNVYASELQKFAELIVRECTNLAKTKSDSIVERAMKYAEDADEETSAKATAWQLLVFEQEIKKHFGVE